MGYYIFDTFKRPKTKHNCKLAPEMSRYEKLPGCCTSVCLFSIQSTKENRCDVQFMKLLVNIIILLIYTLNLVATFVLFCIEGQPTFFAAKNKFLIIIVL